MSAKSIGNWVIQLINKAKNLSADGKWSNAWGMLQRHSIVDGEIVPKYEFGQLWSSSTKASQRIVSQSIAETFQNWYQMLLVRIYPGWALIAELSDISHAERKNV